jgi:stage II sporulation protein P
MLTGRRRNIISKADKILSVLIIAILSIFAVKLGIYVGDRLAEADDSVIKRVETEKFKGILDTYFPLIDFVYNSGNISVSFTGEIKKMLGSIYGFDITTPETVLNSNITLLSGYYPTYQSELIKGTGKADDKITTPEITPTPDSTAQNITPTPSNDETGVHKETETGEVKNTTPQPANEENVTTSLGKVSIQQLEGTNFKLDIEALLKEPLKLKIAQSGPRILIYHTHTTEAYIKNLSELDKTVPARTTDQRYNVLTVGDELTKLLKQAGIGVIHNGSNHLSDGDVGAYARSYDTVSSILKGNPSIGMTLDIHRDGYGETKKLRSVTTINGKNCARIMFVVGSNYNLEHPNWKENLKVALRLQKYLEDRYPDITRPIYISSNRYNEHVTNGSLIVEVGGDGNTIDEATESMKYLSKAIYEVMK